jgi:hypothetical protein
MKRTGKKAKQTAFPINADMRLQSVMKGTKVQTLDELGMRGTAN